MVRTYYLFSFGIYYIQKDLQEERSEAADRVYFVLDCSGNGNNDVSAQSVTGTDSDIFILIAGV